MTFFWRIVAAMVATAVAVLLLPGITLSGNGLFGKIMTLLIVALIMGLVNAVVKPFTQAVSFVVILLTLGLFLLVINALMLLLVSWLCGQLQVGFHVNGFWSALFGSIIISLVSALIGSMVAQRRAARLNY